MRLKRFVKTNWRTLLFATLGGATGIAFVSMLRVDVPLATSMVAFGTLLLAIVTAMTIDNSRRQEECRRKEGLLKEIVDWAINIIGICSDSKGVLREMVGITDIRKAKRLFHAHIVEMKERFLGLHGKTTYISKITERFGKDLLEAVNGLINDLDGHTKLLENWQHSVADYIDRSVDIPDEEAEKIDKDVERLTESANHIIEEAVRQIPKGVT